MPKISDHQYNADKGSWIPVPPTQVMIDDTILKKGEEEIFVPHTTRHSELMQEIHEMRFTTAPETDLYSRWEKSPLKIIHATGDILIERPALPKVTWEEPLDEKNTAPQLVITDPDGQTLVLGSDPSARNIANLRQEAYRLLAIAEALTQAPREALIMARKDELALEHFRTTYADLDRIDEDGGSDHADGIRVLIDQIVAREFGDA